MRQHVQKEAPQEFIRTERHLALSIAVRIILPAEGDLVSRAILRRRPSPFLRITFHESHHQRAFFDT